LKSHSFADKKKAGYFESFVFRKSRMALCPFQYLFFVKCLIITEAQMAKCVSVIVCTFVKVSYRILRDSEIFSDGGRSRENTCVVFGEKAIFAIRQVLFFSRLELTEVQVPPD
jgi:hypothetical protein